MRSALDAELHDSLALVADDRVQAVAPIEVEVHCTLEQIFNGGTEKVYIERKVLQRMGYVLERKVCADKRFADGSIGCGASHGRIRHIDAVGNTHANHMAYSIHNYAC